MDESNQKIEEDILAAKEQVADALGVEKKSAYSRLVSFIKESMEAWRKPGRVSNAPARTGTPQRKERKKRSTYAQDKLAAFRKKRRLFFRGFYPPRVWSPSASTCPVCHAVPSQACVEMYEDDVFVGKFHEDRPGYQGSKKKKMNLVKQGRI